MSNQQYDFKRALYPAVILMAMLCGLLLASSLNAAQPAPPGQSSYDLLHPPVVNSQTQNNPVNTTVSDDMTGQLNFVRDCSNVAATSGSGGIDGVVDGFVLGTGSNADWNFDYYCGGWDGGCGATIQNVLYAPPPFDMNCHRHGPTVNWSPS